MSQPDPWSSDVHADPQLQVVPPAPPEEQPSTPQGKYEPLRAVKPPSEDDSNPKPNEPAKANDEPSVPPETPASTKPIVPPDTEPPLPAMIFRARKKAEKQQSKKPNFFDYLRRPFDGLRFWFWLAAAPSIRRLVHQHYGDILVEWEKGLNVFVGNKKGGAGKTPIAVLIHLVLAWLLKTVIVLLDCNPAGGHDQTREGIKKTVTFHQFLFVGDTSAISSHEAFTSGVVGTHAVFTNAYCISWNDAAHRNDNTALTVEPTIKKLTKIFKRITAVSHTTVMDEGNALTGSWYEAAVRYNPSRSVAVITFQLDQENSESDALETLRAHGEIDPDCADRTVLVITNFVGSWRWWRNKRIRQEQIERCAFQFGIPKERIVIVPRDRIFLSSKEIDPETGEKLPKVVDPRKLRLRTLLAAMQLLVVIARVSREYRKLHTPHEVQQALFSLKGE